MTIPNYTYKMEGQWQTIRGADRKLCALATCDMHRIDGHKIGGETRGLTPIEIEHAIDDAYKGEGVHPRNWRRWLSGLKGERIQDRLTYMTPPAVVDGMTLDWYQSQTILNLTVAGGVMAMGCGLGKTITALAAAWALLGPKHANKRLWIACPRNAMPTWEEHRAWIEENITTDFEIVSIDSLHNMVGLDSHMNSCIIFDEVHLLGNKTSRRTVAAHALRAAFTAGICLTGTFLHGGVEKCLSMLDLAVVGAARYSSAMNCGYSFHCIVKKQVGKRIVPTLGRPPAAVIHRFNEYLAPFCQSMNKTSDVVKQSVNLPDQVVQDVAFPYSETVDEAAVAVAKAHFNLTGELLTMQAVAHALARDGIEAKVAWLDKMTTGTVAPAVLFGVYIATLDAVEEFLISKGATYVRVDGSVTGKTRTQYIKDFQDGKVQYFLAQSDAASVSMNLQRAAVSVMFDPSWKAANYDQGLARTCRRGSPSTCYHFNLITNAFQRMVFTRVQKAMDFDASVAEWQQTKAKLDLIGA